MKSKHLLEANKTHRRMLLSEYAHAFDHPLRNKQIPQVLIVTPALHGRHACTGCLRPIRYCFNDYSSSDSEQEPVRFALSKSKTACQGTGTSGPPTQVVVSLSLAVHLIIIQMKYGQNQTI